MSPPARSHVTIAKREAIAVLLYFAAYLGYLCLHLETERQHWLGLVLLPLGLVWLARRQQSGDSVADLFESVGFSNHNWQRGLLWAFLLGALFTALQVVLSRNRGEIAALLISPRALYLLPLSFGLMLLLAGFTEEFFFRGVLQSRLAELFKSQVWAVIVASLLFGLYHVPYAYFHPRWPSHGNLGAAFGMAMGQGVPAGLVLGTFLVRTRGNLLPCIVLHSMINMAPAALMLSRQI